MGREVRFWVEEGWLWSWQRRRRWWWWWCSLGRRIGQTSDTFAQFPSSVAWRRQEELTHISLSFLSQWGSCRIPGPKSEASPRCTYCSTFFAHSPERGGGERWRRRRRRRRRLGFPPLSLSPPHGPILTFSFFCYRIVRPIIGGNRRQPRSLERARTRLRSPPVCLIDSVWVGERVFFWGGGKEGE